MQLQEHETQADDHRINMEVTTDMEDIQGEGGGGFFKTNAYFNPALTVSTQSICNGKTQTENHYVNQDPEDTVKPQPNLQELCKKKFSKICTRKMLHKRFPITNWLPNYTTEDAIGDLVAGITVGLTVIPQSLAYASIAHVPLQYGLYTSFLGCLVYIFIGSCKDVPFGPTAIVSLMTYEAIGNKGPEHAIVLCFLSGVVQFLLGIFGFGFLIDFVSGPVSSGFTSAVALIILTSQIKDVLGISASGTVFIHTWSNIIKNVHETRTWDAVLGIICICSLLTLRMGSKIPVSAATNDGFKRGTIQIWCNRLLWFLATSRNAILVVICGYVGYFVYQDGDVPFTLIGHVPEGLPTLQIPPFGYEKPEGNTTITVGLNEILSDLGSSIIVVPLLGLLENIAICKAFAHGKPVDSTQEFIAIGFCNILNSFVQAFPASGSVSRSAVQHSSGARTPLCGLYAGTLVILALIFFTPCFFFIPKAALASVLIAAVIFMVEIKVIKPMWRSKKTDLIPGLGTFIACLVFPLEYGVLIGVGLNLIFILHQAARPKITIERLKTDSDVEYLMLSPDRSLIFPSVAYVRNLVTKYSIKENVPVVLDCSHIYSADYTAACAIEGLTADFRTRNQILIFYNLNRDVCDVFDGISSKGLKIVYSREMLHEVLENKSFVLK